MFNCVKTDANVIIGDGRKIPATHTGSVCLQDKDRNTITLHNVLLVPEFAKHIISTGRLVEKGNNILMSKNQMTINNQKNEMELMKQGKCFYLYATRRDPVKRRCDNISEDVYVTDVRIDINKAHDKMGHLGETVLQSACTAAGMQLVGTLKPCDGCLRAKARQKNVPKLLKTKSLIPEKGSVRTSVDLIQNPLKGTSIGD